jgi:hypothetical protein
MLRWSIRFGERKHARDFAEGTDKLFKADGRSIPEKDAALQAIKRILG